MSHYCRNYYEVLGTSMEYIKYLEENEGILIADNFLKKRTKECIYGIRQERNLLDFKNRLLQDSKNRILLDNQAISSKTYRELNQQELAIVEAYNHLGSKELRDIHNRELEARNEEIEKRLSKYKTRTAFDVLGIPEETLDRLRFHKEKEMDTVIEGMKEQLLEFCNKELEKADFKKKIQLEAKKESIEEAYQLVMPQEKRMEYYKEVQKQKEKLDEMMKEEVRQFEIEEKYSHTSEFNPKLIEEDAGLGSKLVERNTIEEEKHTYGNLEFNKIARIEFYNWAGHKFFVDEYQIIKRENGQEKIRTMRTNLEEKKLEINGETGQPNDPEYYDCVMNLLFSDDIIDASQYNAGYGGMLVKNEKGDYHVSLENEKLTSAEQEILAACMILEKRKEMMKSMRGENR